MSHDEISALEAKVTAQHESLQKSVRITQIVYIVLAIIVLVYTSVVVSKLQDATSPEVVAELATSMIQQHVPEQRAKLVSTIRENKDVWAQSAVAQVHASVPALEAQLQVIMDQLAQDLAEQVKDQLMPKFVEFVKADSARLKETFEGATDNEVATGFVEMFIEVIERELDLYLNDKFIDAINNLQKEMHHLSKPGAQLTKREDAQRRLIQNWAHLAEHQEFGTALFTDVLTAMKRKFGELTAEDAGQLVDGDEPIVEDEAIEGVDTPVRLIED